MDRVDLLAMCRVPGVSWHFLAREAQRPDGMERIRAGHATEESSDAAKSLAVLATARDDLAERRPPWKQCLRVPRRTASG